MAKLFDHVGISYPFTKAKKPAPKLEKEWLDALEHPLGDEINELREYEKIRGTFCKNYIIEKNVAGKLYPQFHPLKDDANGTKLGRFASSDPNLQNIPARSKLGKRVRKLFTPDCGHYQWRKHDYSQIHYRILAHNAVDDGDGSAEALRERYRNDPDTDYHLDVYMKAAPLLGWSITDQEEIDIKRRPIKNVNFGLLYGQSEKALAYKAGFSGAQAKDFFRYYHLAAPYVLPTMKAIAREAEQFGYVTTLLGRRERFKLWEPAFGFGQAPLPYASALEVWGPQIRLAFLYRAVNYKFQGSEPDLMKKAMRDCDKSGVFDYVGVPRLTCHDELDWSVKDNSPQTLEAFAFIKRSMELAIPLRVPVKCDATVGPNWGAAK